MYSYDGNKVFFEDCDLAFVNKLGFDQAMEMFLDFRSKNPRMAFIYDTYQMTAYLGGKKLFEFMRNIDKHYKRIELKKKNGKIRVIHAPDKDLKETQLMIKDKLLLSFSPSKYATAYVRGRTLTDNAAPHVGKRYLLKLDITDFFGSIRFDQVYGAAFNTKYFPKQTGYILTSLCCLNEVLPQGAPTSPILSNIVMKNFDDNIGRWCEKRGIAYTRYCDDMTFSSDEPLYHVYQKVKNMLEDMGFELNEDKTRFVTSASRQCVTGLTVNEKVSVSAKDKRELRKEAYYAAKFGADGSVRRTGRAEFINGGEVDEERYLNYLIGKLSYVRQIEPENKWVYKYMGYLRWELDDLHGKQQHRF